MEMQNVVMVEFSNKRKARFGVAKVPKVCSGEYDHFFNYLNTRVKTSDEFTDFLNLGVPVNCFQNIVIHYQTKILKNIFFGNSIVEIAKDIQEGNILADFLFLKVGGLWYKIPAENGVFVCTSIFNACKLYNVNIFSSLFNLPERFLRFFGLSKQCTYWNDDHKNSVASWFGFK